MIKELQAKAGPEAGPEVNLMIEELAQMEKRKKEIKEILAQILKDNQA